MRAARVAATPRVDRASPRARMRFEFKYLNRRFDDRPHSDASRLASSRARALDEARGARFPRDGRDRRGR
jgi:hypothetical protein